MTCDSIGGKTGLGFAVFWVVFKVAKALVRCEIGSVCKLSRFAESGVSLAGVWMLDEAVQGLLCTR